MTSDNISPQFIENFNHIVPAADPALSVLVVSFNTRELTLACLRSLISETRATTIEIIVVDNNSWDDTAAAIRREFPTVTLIALSENIGFAAANNLAASKARGRRFLLLNPDTVVLDGAVDNLFRFADENPLCRIWGGRTILPDGSLDRTSVWRKMSLWSLFCNAFALSYVAPNSPIFCSDAYGGWKRDTSRYVDVVTGCFLLIDRPLWETLGGFDQTFFIYGEEVDLCLRARKVGARPLFTPLATIIHYGGASESSQVEKQIKALKGKITLVSRHFRFGSRLMAWALIFVYPLTRKVAYGVSAVVSKSRHSETTAARWKAVWHRRAEWMNGYSTIHSKPKSSDFQ